MFNLQQLLRQKKVNPTWWIVAVVVGATFLLVFKQLATPVNPLPAVPTPQPTATTAAAAPDKPFLADYNPEPETLLGSASEQDNRSGWEIGTDVILKLVVVLGLVYVALHGLRWLQRNKSKTFAGGATINVLETAGLAPGRSLHLVVVGEKTLLLGATDHQISVLAELSDAAVPVPDEDPAPQPAAKISFDQTLARQVRAQQPPPEPEQISSAPPLPLDGEAAEYTSEWQSTLKDLRAGIHRIQKTVEG